MHPGLSLSGFVREITLHDDESDDQEATTSQEHIIAMLVAWSC